MLDLIRRVRERGLSVVLISHNMPEVLEVADRIEVLRLGERVARFKRAEASMEDLVGAMTGAIDEQAEARMSDAAPTSAQQPADAGGASRTRTHATRARRAAGGSASSPARACGSA